MEEVPGIRAIACVAPEFANYEYYKRPHAHLKKVTDPSLPPILGHKVDVRQNPGHRRLTYAMQLMASPEMWFGPGAWKYFDKKLVTSFPGVEEVRYLTDDIVYVRLFDWETPDYEAPEILSLQAAFRQWTKMDEIEQLLETRKQEEIKLPRAQPPQ
jgi:hypothetical protein